jgi:HD superfamily phosphodiesterase
MILNSRLGAGSGRMLRLEFETSQMECDSLQLLLEVTKAIASELDLEKLLGVIMDKTRECLRAERCSVFMLDEEKQELWTIKAHGLEGHPLRVPLQSGLVGYVARTGETVNVRDAYQDYRFDRNIDKVTGYRTGSILSMPMKNKLGAIIGVFQIINKRAGIFTKDDQDLLEGVVAMAAIAVENAQLYKKTRDQGRDRLIDALSLVPYTATPQELGHAQRVAKSAQAIAEVLGLDESRKKDLGYAGLLHDVVHVETLRNFFLHEGNMTVRKLTDLTETIELAKNILCDIIDKDCLRKLLHIDAVNELSVSRMTRTDQIIDAKILAFCELVDIVLHYEAKVVQDVSEEVRQLLSRELTNHFDQRIVNYFLCHFQEFC